MKNYCGKSKAKLFIIILIVLAVICLIMSITSIFGRNVSDKSKRYSKHNSAVSSEEDETWKLILVNPWNPVPDGYESEINFVKLKYDQSVDERIYPDLQKMMDNCRADGLSPMVCSGYRSVESQAKLFNNKVREYVKQGYSQKKAYNEAKQWLAEPGTSEHHLGLAVDVISENYQFLDEKQEKTPEQQWLLKNCWKYGFILRYPSDKSELTGIHYEPWHYRYVGKKAAEYITKHNLCLEEYLNNL